MSIEWLQTARHSGLVNRCHTVPTIQTYNVAEHSFNAIIIAHSICEEMDYIAQPINYESISSEFPHRLDEDKITRYLLLHDLAEGYTGDIPANVKKETDIKPIMDNIEKEWEGRHVPDYMKVELDDYEAAIAKLSDILELCMFCRCEISMGNKHHAMVHMADRASTYAELHCSNANIHSQIAEEIINSVRGLL